MGKNERITSKSRIIVSYQPWEELSNLLLKEKPDLLCLEWDAHLTALGVTPHDVLTRTSCSVALVRGKLPNKPKNILVPVRGGPHAELSLRLGLGLHAKGVTALHLRRTNDPQADSDAPFIGLERVLQQLSAMKAQQHPDQEAMLRLSTEIHRLLHRKA